MRWGKAGEQLKLLNGNTVTVDEKSRRDCRRQPVGVARRDHGRRCHCRSDDTKNIYIEAAFWWPKAVAGRSRRFNSLPMQATALNAAWTRA